MSLSMRMSGALLLVLAMQLQACGAGHRMNERVARELAGSCQSRCHTEHADSLYDENRCLEQCRPPE